jgi:hypothetical protein
MFLNPFPGSTVTDPETDDWFSQAADDVGEVLNPLNWF